MEMTTFHSFFLLFAVFWMRVVYDLLNYVINSCVCRISLGNCVHLVLRVVYNLLNYVINSRVCRISLGNCVHLVPPILASIPWKG